MRIFIPHYRPSIDTCRFIMMLCVCLNLFGIPTTFGSKMQVFLNFAPCVCFIFSGYLVLRNEERHPYHITRTLLHSGLTFVILFAAYLALNLIFEWEITVSQLSSSSFWLDFLLLNIFGLPIGQPLWFVQALFYAYIIIYILYRLNLLRYDWIIAVGLLVFGFLVGELSGVLHFSFLGRTYISGNFLTRALPYILIGHLLKRKRHSLYKLSIRAWWIIPAGAVLMVGEYVLLDHFGVLRYYGHLVGMSVVAVMICILVITGGEDKKQSLDTVNFRRNAFLITYYTCSPIYYLLSRWQAPFRRQLEPYLGIAVILACLAIPLLFEVGSYFYGWLRHRLRRRRHFQKRPVKKEPQEPGSVRSSD